MVYLFIFLGLILSIIGLSIANVIVNKKRKQKKQSQESQDSQ